MKRCISFIIVAACCLGLSAQDAHESGLSISGYDRATGFMGINNHNDPTLKSLYNETSLKLKAKTGQWGQAYTDMRFRTGTEYGTDFSTLDIREAYLDLYFKKVDLRIGKQISPWGRADGWNPTDNLTPSDYFVRSPDHDDLRLGSYRIRGQYNPSAWLKLEADMVPWYTPSVYRFDQVGMPSYVSISEPVNPGFKWNQTTVATKLDLIFSGIEGSISYYKGYDPLPALRPGAISLTPDQDFAVELLQVPFRQETIGADFATVLLNTGIRGEFAYKIPEQGDTIDPLLPNTDFQWTVSFDRELGSFRIIAGYTGKFVKDFTAADPPQAFDPDAISNPLLYQFMGPVLESQISYYNRILYDQTHEWSHSVIVRPSVTLFHESLEVEFSTMYNFTTQEYLLYPKATYRVTDGLQAIAGYQYYHGGEYTRFNWIEEAFNGPLFELRLTF